MTMNAGPVKSLLAGFFALALTLSGHPVAAQDPTVAIFDFDVGTTQTLRIETSNSDGESASAEASASVQTSLLTNKLVASLTNSREVSVIEREKISKVVEELNFNQTSFTNPARAQQIGKMLGADYMVFGSITLYEPSVTLSEMPYNTGIKKLSSLTVGATIRMVNTETGLVEAAADLNTEKYVEELNPANRSKSISARFQQATFDDLVDKLSSRVIDTLSPIKVAAYDGSAVYLARANLAVGNTYKIIRSGNVIRHPDTGEVLGTTEREIATVQITEGLPQMSKGRVTDWIVSEKDIPEGSIARLVAR